MKAEFNSCIEMYKTPVGALRLGEELNIRIRVEDWCYDRMFLILTKDGEQPVLYEMQECEEDEWFCVNIIITTRGLYFYRFEARVGNVARRIGRGNGQNAEGGSDTEWLQLVYSEEAGDCSWLQGGLIYHILVDRFYIGGERKKTKASGEYREDWYGIPRYLPVGGKILNNDYFGGNLAGIKLKLPYLKSLGVTCIYLSPIFEANSNHKYNTGNYMRVDGDFGSESELIGLIKAAQKKGIRIILDGVFSHTGDDSIYFNKYGSYDSAGAYQSKDSPYYEWYRFTHFPDIYDCWWGISTLPNVCEENKHYNEFINGQEGVVRKYLRMGIAGWRLDVADELPDSFLESLYAAAKKEKADAYIVGEVWENAADKISYGKRRRYFQGGQLSGVTNYPLKDAVISYVSDGNGAKLNDTLLSEINNYPRHSLNSLMNVLGTHDTVRLINNFADFEDISTRKARSEAVAGNVSDAEKRVKMAAALQYMLPGIPCVYYGDEAGLDGFEDPFNRKGYPWGRENKRLLSFYRKLGKIRRDNSDILARGVYNNICCEGGIFAFERTSAAGALTVIVNNSGAMHRMQLSGTELISGKPFSGSTASLSVSIVRHDLT